jgi:hypothetical protein
MPRLDRLHRTVTPAGRRSGLLDAPVERFVYQCFDSHIRPMTPALSWEDLPLTQLVHENFSVVMSYAFATPAISKWITDNFAGGWGGKYLDKCCFEMPEQRARLALLQFATQLRLLDNTQKLSRYFENTKRPPFGKLIKLNGAAKGLTFRDVMNKIIHSSKIEWIFDDSNNPIIICHSDDPSEWLRAEIEIAHLAFFCSSLMV